MRLAAFILSCCLFLQSAPARAAEPDVPEGWTISKVVVLASSGVRAPTHFEEQLQSMELGRTWKEWGVGAGELTQRGAGLIQAMWMPLGIELRKLAAVPEESLCGADEALVFPELERLIFKIGNDV